MRGPNHRPILGDALRRGLRFLYLLWGGMLLGTLAAGNRIRLPDLIWRWPKAAAFAFTPWGRGLLLGLALVMSIAALVEIWELVDRLLMRFMHDADGDR
jgi:hypothetical protein